MLKRVAFLALLIAMYSMAVFTTNGCAGSDPLEVETVLIALVTDEGNGSPIPAAEGSIQGVIARANEQGQMRLGGLTPGEGRLVVEHRLYVTREVPVVLTPGNTVVDVKLRRR